MDSAAVGVLLAIASILGSRLLLLLAVGGAFVLALLANDNLHLGILVAYCLLICCPLVYLDIDSRRK
jgi:hypothetical protein